MLVREHQYVNFHAHRKSQTDDEWVLMDYGIERLQEMKAEANTAFSIGIHPWFIPDIDIEHKISEMMEIIDNPLLAAIGEAGLDKMCKVPMDLQKEVFQRQLEIASDAQLPVIIHLVRAVEELFALIKQNRPATPLIIHGFSGGIQLGDDLVKKDLFLSFGKSLMQSEKTQQAFCSLPLERLFLETDDADIDIRELYEFAAGLRDMKEIELRSYMSSKVNQLFL